MNSWLRSPMLIPVGVFALLAAAVFTGRTSRVDPQGRPIVVYAHPPCPPELMELYRPIWDEFRRTHPNIDLRVLHITGSYEDKVKVMIAGNVAPDVIFMYPTALAAWVEETALEPIDEYLATADVSTNEYFAPMLDAFRYKGRLYGLPKDASAIIMEYNAEMFERYGVTPPRADWTWQDLLKAAQALTRDTNGDGRVDQWGMTSPPWWEFVWQNGGRILDESGRHCMLLEPEAVEALEFWSALRAVHGVTPTPEAEADTSASQLFSLGRVGMTFGMYPSVSVFRKTCAFRWDLAHPPRGPRGRATTVVGSAFAITCQSRQKTAAFEFIRWHTASMGMRFLVSVESPSCTALAQSPDFLNSVSPPSHKEVAVEAMAYARKPLQHPRYAEIMDILGPELDRAQRGGVSVLKALQRAAPRVDAVLQR